MGLLRYYILLVTICMTGCVAHQLRTDLSEKIQVFGIELHSGVDYREIGGVAASEEPCLKGYERSFDTLDITIGYGFDRKIRKITSRNPETSIFGIAPGMTIEEGERRARQAGLQGATTYTFQGQGINLALLVDSHGKIFGITVQSEE